MKRGSAPLTVAAAILLAGLVVPAGCRPQTDQQPPATSQAEPPAPAREASQTYQTTGVIRSITPSRSYATIQHADIPGFMEAMTMPFATTDSSLLAGVHPGDSVAFTFTVGGGGAVVQTLRPAGPQR